MIRPFALAMILATPAGASTLHIIEASDCGTVHTLHEDMTSAVVATERGSRHYVCGPYPENPLTYLAALDIKGWHPETTEFAPRPDLFWSHVPAAANPPGGSLARATGGASAFGGGMSASSAGASSFSSADSYTETHIHFDGCPCGCCDKPEPPVVPLPAAGWLMLAALGMLWRVRHG